jgi:hypothetical protein
MLKLPEGHYPKPTRAGWVKTPEQEAIFKAAEKWSLRELGYALTVLEKMNSNGEEINCSYLQSAIFASLLWKTKWILMRRWAKLKITGTYQQEKNLSAASAAINLKKWLAGDLDWRARFDPATIKHQTVRDMRVKTGMPIGMKIIKAAVAEYKATQ